jgi:hypothetical protein
MDYQIDNANGKKIMRTEVLVEVRWEQNPNSRDIQLHVPIPITHFVCRS